jgi:transposase
MRGRHDPQGAIFYAIDVEQLVPAEHPLREIRRMANEELKRLSPLFERAYSQVGRPSVPPEQLIKASLLQALYSIRSERQLCEQLAYNLLFRWFVGLQPDERVWDPTVFTINRRRFDEHGMLRAPSSRARCRRQSARRRLGARTSPSTGRCSRRGRR